MNWQTVSNLGPHALADGIRSQFGSERESVARGLAYLAEFDACRHYVPEGYPSMSAWCVGEVGMTTDVAKKRIQAAKIARSFPGMFDAVREGRLTVSAICELATRVNPGNVNGLLELATGATIAELRERLALRETGAGLLALETSGSEPDTCSPPPPLAPTSAAGPVPGVPEATPESVTPPCQPDTIGAISHHVLPETRTRHPHRIWLGHRAEAHLQRAIELLGHELRSRDESAVVERALGCLVQVLERRQAATRPRRRPRRGRNNPRHIPVDLRQQVWKRDGGRCTFTSDRGHRCEATARLEYDHVTPVARGGESTLANLRLRCRAHNQYAAEQAFGAGYMKRKREASRAVVDERRARRAAEALAAAETRAREEAQGAALRAAAEEAIPFLRRLGCRSDQAKQLASDAAVALPEASLEDRVRHALRKLAPASARRELPSPGAAS